MLGASIRERFERLCRFSEVIVNLEVLVVSIETAKLAQEG